MEFRICQAMMAKHDFYEGVRANLVDKDRKPKWNPKNVYELSNDAIEEHFKNLDIQQQQLDIITGRRKYSNSNASWKFLWETRADS